MSSTKQGFIHKDAWTIHRDLWNKPKLSGIYATALGVAEGGTKDRRDKALETGIASALGVSALTKKDLFGIPAQRYMMKFLLALQPLALMYKDICDYAERTNTKTSGETKAIEWYFKVSDENITINLEHFRRYEALRSNLPEPKEFVQYMQIFQNIVFSEPIVGGKPVPDHNSLAFIDLPDTESDELKAAYELSKRIFVMPFDERVKAGYAFGNEFPAYLWILQTRNRFSDNRFAGLFPPPGCLEALDPQDILDLPFWRYRWQIYELWILVITLDELQRYGFVTRLSSDGDTLLQMNKHALVAARECAPVGYAHYQPSFRNKENQVVQPDVVVSTAKNAADIDPTNTYLIIEAKQRKEVGGLEKNARYTSRKPAPDMPRQPRIRGWPY